MSQKVGIQKFGHVAMRVHDMDKVLSFYRDALGLEHVFGLQDDAGKPWIEYVKIAENQYVELFHGGTVRPDAAYDFDRIGYHHFAISVGDIAALAKKLFAMGLLEKDTPSLNDDGNLGLWIEDPEGNAIEIVEYQPTSPVMKTNHAAFDYPVTPGVKGIAHVSFVVENMDEAVDYFEKRMGFEHVLDLPDKEGKPFLKFLRVCDGQYMELFYTAKHRRERKAGEAGYEHLCFIAEDVQKSASSLKDACISIDAAPKLGKDGNLQLWCHDTDQNPIEIVTLMPGASI